MAKNADLNKANKAKKDEFYTQLTDIEKSIVAVLKDGQRHVDEICLVLQKKVFEIMPTLSILEIKGVIIKSGVNVFGLTKNYLEE